MIANMFSTKSGNWFTKKMLPYSFIERDPKLKLVKIVFDFGFMGRGSQPHPPNLFPFTFGL